MTAEVPVSLERLEEIDKQILGGVLPGEIEDLNKQVDSLRSELEKLSKLPAELLEKEVMLKKLPQHIQELLGEAGIRMDPNQVIVCGFDYDQAHIGGRFRLSLDGSDVEDRSVEELRKEFSNSQGYIPGPINTLELYYRGLQVGNQSSLLNIRPLDRQESYVYPEWRGGGINNQSQLEAYAASKYAQRLQLLTAPHYITYHLILGKELVSLFYNASAKSSEREMHPFLAVTNTREI